MWEDARSIREIAKEIQTLLGPDPGEASAVVQDQGRSPSGEWSLFYNLFSKEHPQQIDSIINA